MRTSRHQLVLWLAAAAVTVAGGSSPASAQLAGGGGPACQRVLPTTNIQFSSSGAANKGPGNASANCSAVRLSTTSPAVVTINAVDGNVSGGLNCLIIVRSFNGASQLFSASHTTTAAFTGAVSFSSTIPTATVGYVTTTCDMPEPGAQDSRLVGFTIQ
jgi:hypothetical protein